MLKGFFIVIDSLCYSCVLFMTHVTHTHKKKQTYAVGLLLSKSPAVYFPQNCVRVLQQDPQQWSKKSEKSALGVNSLTFLATWDNPEAITEKLLVTLPFAANHCDLNENRLFFNNALQTQVHLCILGGFSVGTKIIPAPTSFFLSHGFRQYIRNPFKAHNRGGTHASCPRLSLRAQRAT